jgi:hypothetical protein
MVMGVNPDLMVVPPDWIVAHMLSGLPLDIEYAFTVRLLAACATPIRDVGAMEPTSSTVSAIPMIAVVTLELSPISIHSVQKKMI